MPLNGYLATSRASHVVSHVCHSISILLLYLTKFLALTEESSHDHRGTPEAPGRVVTLVRAEDWHSLPHADELADGDLVWGVAYRIDPAYVAEVRAYLDHREKDGYSCQTVDVINIHDGVERTVVKAVRVTLLTGELHN